MTKNWIKTPFGKTKLYARVSGNKQEEQLQLDAARSFLLEHGHTEEVEIIIDHAVSANKLGIYERKGLVDLLQRVESGEVNTLIVYRRDRLARNPYEWIRIHRILVKNKVNVFFTSPSSYPFGTDVRIEALLGWFAWAEGQQIAKTTKDARMRRPTHLFGYDKSGEGTKVMYTPKKELQETINDLFNQVATCPNLDTLVAIVDSFKTVLHRQPKQLMTLLETPLYAGCIFGSQGLTTVDYAMPVVSRETFEEVQTRLAEITLIPTTTDFSIPSINPTCGICGQRMTLTQSFPGPEWTCGSKHKKLRVAWSEVNSAISKVLKMAVKNLDQAKFRSEVLEALESLIDKHRREHRRITNLLKEQALTLSVLVGEQLPNKYKRQLSDYDCLRKDLQEVDRVLDILSSERTRIVEFVESRSAFIRDQLLFPDQLTRLSKAVIDSVVVDETKTTVHVYYSDYWRLDDAGA